MKNFIRLTDYTASDIYDIFRIADKVLQGKYHDILKGKSVVLFSQVQASEQGLHLKREFIC